MTPAEIKKTRLYRTLAPKIRKQDREEFARMLALVPEKARQKMDADSVLHAFVWDETPQGADYWYELYWRLDRYAAGPRAQLPEDFQP